MFNSRTAKLLYADVERLPFNLTFRQTLAGYLASGNDPRGQFILEQCKPEADQDPDLISRLLAEHGRHWAAQDLGIKESDIPAGATVEFYQGFAWWPVQTSYPNFQGALSSLACEVSPDITTERFHLHDAPVDIIAKVVLYKPSVKISSRLGNWDLRRRLQLHVETDQIWELCAFGQKYPNVQCQFPIAAPGSVCLGSDGVRLVPCLGRWLSLRRLRLGICVTEFPSHYRLLATR